MMELATQLYHMELRLTGRPTVTSKNIQVLKPKKMLIDADKSFNVQNVPFLL